MLKKFFTLGAAMAIFFVAKSQDSTKGTTTITGSVDGYYRYDFAGKGNNYTSFTNSANSFELGMASIKFDHSFGKVAATADLGFGRRAEEFSYNDGAGWNSTVPANGKSTLAVIKQAYLSYAYNSKIKFTAGKWATHIGWELVDAYSNRNYSMSYGFSNGPFFHTGFKTDIAISSKTAFMVGIANPTDFSSTSYDLGGSNKYSGKMVIAQFSTGTKNDKLKAYLNYQGGTNATLNKISQLDLVLNYVPTSKLGVVYDGTIQNQDGKNWSSNALYLNYDPTSKFGLTLRGESFEDQSGIKMSNSGYSTFPSSISGVSLVAATLSANIKIDGHLVIIPEIRTESANGEIYAGKDAGAKSATSFIIAATYKF